MAGIRTRVSAELHQESAFFCPDGRAVSYHSPISDVLKNLLDYHRVIIE